MKIGLFDSGRARPRIAILTVLVRWMRRAGDEVGRRHHAVGGLVMLVDADAVEAELLAIDEEVDMALVFVGALDRIVEAVGQHDPGRAVLRRRLEIERAIGHQVEGEELHRTASLRKARTLGITSSAFSTWGAWPHFSTMTSPRASGRRCIHSSAYAAARSCPRRPRRRATAA